MDNTDIYVYTGDVQRDGYLDLTNVIKKRKTEQGLRDSVLFCVATYGGDPDAGYRLGRTLQHNYNKVTVLIVGPCKSAGTLIAIAANKLIFGDMGELGPLDIQLKKSDEIGEMSSGLAIMTALDALKERAISAFNAYLVQIRYENRISTKMSADIASKLTEAIISPMAAQIDPIRLGEHQRAMNIAIGYGKRLSEKSNSLKPNSLYTLIASYPSHGFVIDRKEARQLFNDVESPEGQTAELYNYLCEQIHNGITPIFGKPKVQDFTLPLPQPLPQSAQEEDENHGKLSESGYANPEQKAGGTNPGGASPSKRSRKKPDEGEGTASPVSD